MLDGSRSFGYRWLPELAFGYDLVILASPQCARMETMKYLCTMR